MQPGHNTSTGRGVVHAIAAPPNDAPQRPQNFVPEGCSIPQRVQRILPADATGTAWFKLGDPERDGGASARGAGMIEGTALSEVTG